MSRRAFGVFEHHLDPVISPARFMQRMIKCGLFSASLLVGTISLGTMVYHWTEGQDWLEAALNAVLIMTGLGLEDNLHSVAAKLFTCFYAPLTAVVFYMILAIIFAPLIHRFLHEFHLESGSKGNS